MINSTVPATGPLPAGVSQPYVVLTVDGRTITNPGPGGYAFLAMLHGVDGQEVATHAASGASRHITTPNRAMVFAALQALAFVSLEQAEGRWPVCPVKLTTYLDYVIKGIVRDLPRWRVNGWKGFDGKLIKNDDLWQKIAPLVEKLDLSCRWQKKGTGGQAAIRAAHLAAKAADSAQMRGVTLHLL